MKKIIKFALLTLILTTSLSASEIKPFAPVKDEDFFSAGVSKENLEKAKEIAALGIEQLRKINEKKDNLEKEIEKYDLDNIYEKDLAKLYKIYDEMGKLDAEEMKLRVQTQVKLIKYISKDQYKQAKNNYSKSVPQM